MGNWPRFLFTYLRLLDGPAIYSIRSSGQSIIARSGVDVSTIAVIFIKEDYGAAIEGPVVVDIGASIGASTLFASSSPGNRVYAYEPVPSTFEQLKENIALNRIGERVSAHCQGGGGTPRDS